jgi:YgiT-type zinc finger domain-containing protein
MKCVHCQGEMTRSTTPFHIDHTGWHIVLDKLPVWVCAQCGEPYFEEDEVNAIQDLIRSVEQNAERLALSA